MSNLRYSGSPLAAEAWQVSTWDAGQSSILRWSSSNVVWNSLDQTLDFLLSRAPSGSARPFLGGEIQSVETASTGTWGWTARVPELVSGSVFGLFTYKANHNRDPWLEFDLEFLGVDAGKYRDPTSGDIRVDPDGDIDGDGDIDIYQVRLNIHMETRKLGHVTLEDAKGAPVVVNLPFDATEGQHSYDVKVTDTTATFTADGVVIGTFSAKDMPGGVWTSGAMKSFVNLWCVDPSLEDWAGKWSYPGDHKLAGKVSAVTYQPLGGEPHLIGGPGAGDGATDPSQVFVERQGGSGADGLDDIAGAPTDFQGGAGDDTFRFVKALGPRGGVAEKDVIWDFNPHGDTLAEDDTVQVSKGLVGVNGFAGLYRAISDVGGEAVLRFADGSTLTFHGLQKADLGYDDFVLV